MAEETHHPIYNGYIYQLTPVIRQIISSALGPDPDISSIIINMSCIYNNYLY